MYYSENTNTKFSCMKHIKTISVKLTGLFTYRSTLLLRIRLSGSKCHFLPQVSIASVHTGKNSYSYKKIYTGK